MNIDKKSLIKEMQRYASAQAELKKIEDSIELKVRKIRTQYNERIKKWLQVQSSASERLQTIAFYQYDELFAEEKQMDLMYGRIGFRKSKCKVVKRDSRSWEEVHDACQRTSPNFLRWKKELAQDKILEAIPSARVTEELQELGLSIIQDEYFFIKSYKE